MRLTRLIPAAATAALIAAVSVASLPGPAAEVPAVTQDISVTPTPLPLACPGPLVVPVGDIDTGDSDLDAGSDDRTFWSAPEGDALGEGSAVAGTWGTQVERVGGGDIAGLAGTACAAPSQDQWLVAGATSLGASARLVLSNTSDASVRAHVTLHGPVGVIDEAIVVSVAPHSQQSVLLEGVEAEVPALAIHVVAGGVGVGAALQDSRLQGFVAAGTEWAAPTHTGTDLIVPVAGPVTADAAGTLRLVAPDGADVTLSLWGADGERGWLGDDVVTLEAGAVTDLALPAGDLQAVRVEADAPVAAAASVSVARDAPADTGVAHALDLAWTEAQAVTEDERAVVVPDGDVSIVAAAAESTPLTLTDADGTVVIDEPLSAGTVQRFDVEVEPGTVLIGTGPAAWALAVADSEAGFLTTLSPTPTSVPDRLVTIAPGTYVGSP